MSKIENDDKILYLLTSEFPFGNGEAFIGNEIHFLSNEFNKVVIICGVSDSYSHRFVPDNVEIKPVIYDYTFSLKEIIFSIKLRENCQYSKELNIEIYKYKPNKINKLYYTIEIKNNN